MATKGASSSNIFPTCHWRGSVPEQLVPKISPYFFKVVV